MEGAIDRYCSPENRHSTTTSPSFSTHFSQGPPIKNRQSSAAYPFFASARYCDVALGVDDDGGRTGLIPKQIGGVRQATQVVLFQDH